MTVVGNGATWDRFEPKTKISRKQNLIFNSGFCARFRAFSGFPPFPAAHNPKNYFYESKTFFFMIS